MPVTYAHADLEKVVQSCTDLTANQKSNILQILCNHETLFLGRRGNWKGQPMSIEVMEWATLVWLKPYEYTLPTIDEMFQNIGGFTFASVTDLNMGYLSIPLT